MRKRIGIVASIAVLAWILAAYQRDAETPRLIVVKRGPRATLSVDGISLLSIDREDRRYAMVQGSNASLKEFYRTYKRQHWKHYGVKVAFWNRMPYRWRSIEGKHLVTEHGYVMNSIEHSNGILFVDHGPSADALKTAIARMRKAGWPVVESEGNWDRPD